MIRQTFYMLKTEDISMCIGIVWFVDEELSKLNLISVMLKKNKFKTDWF